MSVTINLVGPSTSPGAPQITPTAVNGAVNPALEAIQTFKATGATTARAQTDRAADIANPLDYGAIGDGSSHPASGVFASLADCQAVYPFASSLYQEMDWLAWQLCLNNGGPVETRALHYIMCNSNQASMTPLIVYAGNSWVEGHGARMDFSAMQMPPDNTTHYLANYNFATNTNWANDTPENGALQAVFGGGAATMVDPGTGADFWRWGQQITLQPGNYQCNLTVFVTLGESYLNGSSFTQPQGGVGWWGGPGSNDYSPLPTMSFPPLLDIITLGLANPGDQNIADVQLLCHADGGFTDSSPAARTLTSLGPTITTSNPKFGTGCITGLGSVTVGGTAATSVLGSGQFTLECWAYFTSAPSGTLGALAQWGSSGYYGWLLGFASGDLTFFYSTTGSDYPAIGDAYSPPLNTWIHLAVDRDASNVIRVYANGVVIASATYDGAFYAADTSATIGWSGATLGANLDEIRITVGVARYGGAFTPPTGAFSNSTLPPVGLTVSVTANFNIASVTTVWLACVCEGYANFSVTSFDLIPYEHNCAVLLTRDGSAASSGSRGEHYPIPMPLRGLEIIGNSQTNTLYPIVGNLNWPPMNLLTGQGTYGPYTWGGVWTPGIAGVLFETLVAADQDGNNNMLADCSIHGFSVGIWIGDAAYLLEFRNAMLFGNDICVFFNGGNNAGENIRFYGGGMFNSATGICNPGGCEVTLYGTALDYCTSPAAYNAGRIELHGVHVENRLGLAPLFHCVGAGVFTMFGGVILGVVAGLSEQALAAIVPPIQLDNSNSVMSCFGTQIWNLISASGKSMAGPGTWRNFGWINQGNAGNQQPGTDPVMDPLGGAGSLEPPSTFPSPSPMVGVDPTGILIPGGVWDSSGVSSVTSRWVCGGLSCELSTSLFHSGTRSIACTKAASDNTDYQIVFMVPVVRAQDASLSFWYCSPNSISSALAVTSITSASEAGGYVATVTTTVAHGLPITGSGDPPQQPVTLYIEGASPSVYNGLHSCTVTTTTQFTYKVAGTPTSPATGTILWCTTLALYCRAYWVQVSGYDQYGRPVFGPGNTFKGESDIAFPACGDANWYSSSFGTQYNIGTDDPAQGAGPGAPLWATHFAIILDTESLPAMTFYIDDFTAFVI